MRPLALSVALLALAPLPSRAATFTDGVDAHGHPFVRLEGEILAGDGEAFLRSMPARSEAGRPYLVLSSPGGDGWEGVRLALMVRAAGMATSVPDGALCASSCFSVLAGARERFVSREGRVVVHRTASGDVESHAADHATLDLVGLYRSWGVPTPILGGLASTYHGGGYFLDMREKGSLGRVTRDGLPPAGRVAQGVSPAMVDDNDVERAMSSLRPGGGGWRPSHGIASGEAATRAEVRGGVDWGQAALRVGIDGAVCSAYLALVALTRGLGRRFRPRLSQRRAPLPPEVVDIATRR